jgi:hypothetical protein
MVFATVPILYMDQTFPLGVFDVGDRVDLHYTPEACEWLVENGQASHERPDKPAVYALATLSARPHPIQPGERIEHRFVQPVLRRLVADGLARVGDAEDE